MPQPHERLEPERTAPRESALALRLAWATAIVLLLFISIWPLVSGMVAANDDLKFIRGEQYSGTLIENLREGWTHAASFRPLENLAAEMCDERTLECRPVMAIQIAGLIALAAGCVALVRRIVPRHPIAAPLLLIWLALSPATTASLWQMDTCSQTWSAALGVWTGLLAWRALDAARERRSMWLLLLALIAQCAIAMNIKEMFYGWSAGIGLALIIAIASLARRDRVAALRASLILLPVALMPAVHLLYRLKFAGLSATSQASGSADTRYEITLGANLLKNAWLSALGVFSNGPLHLLLDTAAPLPLRLLPLASLIAMFVALAAAGALALLHRRQSASVRGRALMLAAFAGLLSVSITLPMGSVSELYGLGANVASGLLLVASLVSLWFPAQADERTMCRAIAATCATVVLLAGAYGVVSRAYHFRLTWMYASTLNQIVLAHQESLEPSDRAAVIYFDRPCYSGHLHNQYVVSPVQALGLEQPMLWMNRMDPRRQVVFALDRPLAAFSKRDLQLDCKDMPVRGHW